MSNTPAHRPGTDPFETTSFPPVTEQLGNPFNTHQHPQNPQQAFHPQQPPIQYQQPKSSAGKIIAVILIIVLAPLALLAGCMLFAGYTIVDTVNSELKSAGFSYNDTEGAVETVTVLETPGANNRPTEENFPIAVTPVNSAAINDEPAGKFTKYFKSGATSDPFATAVGDQFRINHNATGKTSDELQVFSPVTNQTYTMQCIDQHSYVHCTGGNNAHVYIS
ncbi:hypothetical protein [Corynebacterium mustelae]|nr:hypothetical protein [Corynebacterium mustelae]